MPGYPVVEPDRPAPGRIVILHDDDGDARFDRRTIFAEGLRYANSILPYRGGLLVSDAPDLLYVKDTDGDGRADVRQVILSGFGTGPSESSFNGLRHGLDNWVYGAIGANGGNVYFPQQPGERRPLRGRDFAVRFGVDPGDPHRLAAGELREAGASGDGFGLDFDAWGRRFVVDEQKHIQAEIFPDTYLPEAHTWPATVVEISDHGRDDVARVYPISRVEERPNHPEQAGYFTAGCGLTFYGGGMLPAGFENSFVVAEAVHNLVHRDLVEPEGAGFVARRDRPRAELLASRDNSFRPVNFAVGPDGALYLLDMHRDVIEHPEWIPDEIERQLDVRAGSDQGRVYRLVGRDGLPPLRVEPTDLALATPQRLTAWFEHPNKWWRDTAQRLLVERGPVAVAAAIPELVLMAREPWDALTRLHALWTLDGLGELRDAEVVAALESDSWGLRENALRLAERRVAGARVRGQTVEQQLLAQMVGAATDPAPRVRMQAFLSAGAVWDSLPGRAHSTLMIDAARALHADASDPWIRLAALALSSRSPVQVLGLYGARLRTPALEEGARDGLFGLGRLIGESAATGEVSEGLDLRESLELALLLTDQSAALGPPLLDGIVEGLERGSGLGRALPALSKLDGALQPLRTRPEDAVALPTWRISRMLGWAAGPGDRSRARTAAGKVTDPTETTDTRILALGWLDELAESDPSARATLLLDLLDARVPAELQQAALDRLARSEDALVGRELIGRWRTLGPQVRQRAADFLVYRPFNHDALLDALESGELEIGQLNLHLERRRALLRARDPETRRRAAAFLSDLEVLTRADAVAAMRPALALPGDADRGREVFRELCARCHRIREAESGPGAVVGMEIGPSLTDIFRRSPESLLVDIVDPNAAVDPSYLVFDVTTLAGETTSGLLLAQDERGVTVRNAEGADVRIAVEQIDEISASGLSLMPEELESGLDVARLADLLAYLSQPR